MGRKRYTFELSSRQVRNTDHHKLKQYKSAPMKSFLITFMTISFLSYFSPAQEKTRQPILNPVITNVKDNMNWYDLQKQQSPVLQGVGWNEELKGTFGRLPLRAKEKVRPDIWSLSGQCAGISVRFLTNASEISVFYQVSGGQAFPHMPATGVSGLDLYTTDDKGRAVWSAGGYSFGDTIKFRFKNLTSYLAGSKGREYQLFLPLYNHVKWMEIGLPEDAKLSWVAPSSEKPIVVYGTSIAQGGCASRPGMAWTGILNRELPYPMINLGFSGNGMLEKEVLNFVNEIDARLYILDCLPNLISRPSPEIETATLEAVRQIRTLHEAPILIVDHVGYTDSFVDKKKYDNFIRANQASLKAFNQLKKEGIKKIYYLTYKDLKMPMDGMVDGIHPSDYGMRAYANAYERIIRKILRDL